MDILLKFINPIEWVKWTINWLKRPKPEIRFDYLLSKESENNYCHYRTILDTGGCGWFFRLGVNDTGKTPIIDADVRVEKIERVFPDEKVFISGTPFFLHWANENTDNSRTIHSRTPEYVDVVHTVEGKNQAFLFCKQKHVGAGINNILSPGNYLITIKLLAKNIAPLERKIRIELSSGGKLNMELLD